MITVYKFRNEIELTRKGDLTQIGQYPETATFLAIWKCNKFSFFVYPNQQKWSQLNNSLLITKYKNRHNHNM